MSLFNKNGFRDFTKERYLSLIRLHPKLTEEKAQMYVMLILTFISLSFLGIFAINPTLTTIVELNRKLQDSEFIHKSLTTKIRNLSSLNTQYDALSDTWPLVSDAVPNNPQAAKLLGQIQSIAKDSNVILTDLQSTNVELPTSDKKPNMPKQLSFAFHVSANGEKNNLIKFVEVVSNFNRLVAFEEISYEKSDRESVSIKGRVFLTL